MGSKLSASSVLMLVAFAFVSTQAAAQLPPLLGEFGTPLQLQVQTPVAPPTGFPPTTAPTAAATYYVAPSWSQTLPANQRFVVLANFANEAILDRETGLVWARQPATFNSTGQAIWSSARIHCNHKLLIRGGWRLPSVAELLSLVQVPPPGGSDPAAMPAGHPFMLNTPQFYWAGDVEGDTRTAIALPSGGGLQITGTNALNQVEVGALCVRGPANYLQ